MSDAPLRVTFVLHSFDRGGSGRVAAYLARGFADRGMAVELLVMARGGDVESLAAELAGDRIAVTTLGGMSGSRAFDLLRTLPALVRRLRRAAPAVVIGCANNVALTTAIAFRLAGLPRARLFLKTTNPIASSRHTGLVRWLRRWSYGVIFRWTDAVWTLSLEESAEMRAAFPRFASLFHDVANPYVTPAMLALPAEPSAQQPGKTIICVARLTAQKRLERLIEAFPLVSHPDTRLLILGEGEQRAMLEAQIARLGLGDRIAMPGYVDDVAAALHAADLFVLPSDYEGLPAVVLEAMAANCPVLTTDCFPAARSLMTRGQGCAIIEHTDPASLAALIDAHLGQPRPTSLRAIATTYSIANGIASHAEALSR